MFPISVLRDDNGQWLASAISGLCVKPYASRKHACDQDAQRDVIEDVVKNVNVHSVAPAMPDSVLPGCQCDKAP
jgi:hypothetical protein